MNKLIVMFVALALGSGASSGCANMSETQKDTGTGAAIGAVAGAVLGGLTAGGNRGAARPPARPWARRWRWRRLSVVQAYAGAEGRDGAGDQGSGVSVSQTADNQLKLDIPSDVSFDVGRYDIKPNLRPILDRFAATLNQNPVTTVNIVGHTDNTGSNAVNDPLSLNRARATRDYLTAHGVAEGRISIAGRGSHEPVASNASAAGRAKNRRVEIFVAEAARG